MNIKVDRAWDWKMRLIGRGVIVALVALYPPVVFGSLTLLAITVPVGATVLTLEMRRLRRDREDVGIVTDADIAHKRRRRAVVLAISVVVFAIGLIVDALPSERVHDQYWFLFVAPPMIAFIVSVPALLMLGWSYIPRREDGTRSFSPTP
ncbi:MAG: hypothetical protein ABR529_15390 [Actinomycetota bacterium]